MELFYGSVICCILTDTKIHGKKPVTQKLSNTINTAHFYPVPPNQLCAYYPRYDPTLCKPLLVDQKQCNFS